ncbi:phosphoglycolate phosphatase [Pyrofollis japonicus]|uniref:phosphoglycolate phosphatase n=1 Tax=Pyrofollis japonicus TaxID=3060460 RepID=UPI00295A6200|nr:phosphoglycolate phosphatase [Pyrofollis japonicus]BEP16818.1 phosphoglycolate phosphatase [Pyrofollis japonicus]
MDLAERLRRALRGPVCGVALDIDGTLTEKRMIGHFRIHLGAIEAIRMLEDNGVPVMLVTGNSAFVVAGVGRYLGASGPYVGENGCIVFRRGRLYSVCRYSVRAAARLIEEELGGLVTPSWQNRCRLHDYAFIAEKSRVEEAIRAIEGLLASRGITRVKLSHSGYAIHVRPPDASKGKGLLHALRILGLDPGCVVAVGDSAMDAEMMDAGVVLAAVGNAEDELKRRAHIVLPGESGESVRILVDTLVENGLIAQSHL